MTLALLLVGAALAGGWGNPARGEGLLSADLTGTYGVHNPEVVDCAEEDCTQRVVSQGPGLRLGLRPHPAVALSLSAGVPLLTVKESSFEARVPALGAGLALTLPLQGPRPALLVEATRARGQSLEGDALLSTYRAWAVEGAAVVALGGLDQEVSAWAGVAGRVQGQTQLAVVEDELTRTLAPPWPLGLVAGAELFSAPLGAPWLEDRPRVSFGVELRGVDRWSGEAWAGVVW